MVLTNRLKYSREVFILFTKVYHIFKVAFCVVDSVKPICLPYEDNEKEDYHFNSQGDKLDSVVAGWGATDPRGKYYARINTM